MHRFVVTVGCCHRCHKPFCEMFVRRVVPWRTAVVSSSARDGFAPIGTRVHEKNRRAGYHVTPSHRREKLTWAIVVIQANPSSRLDSCWNGDSNGEILEVLQVFNEERIKATQALVTETRKTLRQRIWRLNLSRRQKTK